jgi:ubiquitin carboxyl-terminal hydrolase 25/28
LNKKAEDKEELFSALILPLDQKPRDIYAALDAFFDIGEVTVNNEKLQRYPTLTQLPPILQLYFQRQDFDVERAEAYLIKHYVQLEDVVYMDRYISPSQPAIQRLRQQSWDLKHKLHKLQAQRTRLSTTKIGLTGPDALDASWEFITEHGDDLSPDQALLDELKSHSNRRRIQIENLDRRIDLLQTNINHLFSQFQDTPYRLAAVFVHRGDTKSGHYWIYIRDFDKNIWRRYEDQTVRDAADHEIFEEANPANHGAPYFVVYVQDGHKSDLVEALWRLDQSQGEEVQDVVMEEQVEPSEGVQLIEIEENFN